MSTGYFQDDSYIIYLRQLSEYSRGRSHMKMPQQKIALVSSVRLTLKTGKKDMLLLEQLYMTFFKDNNFFPSGTPPKHLPILRFPTEFNSHEEKVNCINLHSLPRQSFPGYSKQHFEFCDGNSSSEAVCRRESSLTFRTIESNSY